MVLGETWPSAGSVNWDTLAASQGGSRQTNPGFKASDGWAQKFKRCHNLAMQAHTSMAQKLPGDLESKVVSFRDQVHSIRSRTDIDYALLGTWTRPLSSLTLFLGGQLKSGEERQYEWGQQERRSDTSLLYSSTQQMDTFCHKWLSSKGRQSDQWKAWRHHKESRLHVRKRLGWYKLRYHVCRFVIGP